LYTALANLDARDLLGATSAMEVVCCGFLENPVNVAAFFLGGEGLLFRFYYLL
jgi:hypothetical protein